MGRLINVLTDKERAVKVRISVLLEQEKELLLKIYPLQEKIQQLETTVRNLQRDLFMTSSEGVPQGGVRTKAHAKTILKSHKLKKFRKDQVWPREDWKWDRHNTRTTY